MFDHVWVLVELKYDAPEDGFYPIRVIGPFGNSVAAKLYADEKDIEAYEVIELESPA